MACIDKEIFQGLMMSPFHYACFTKYVGYSEDRDYTVHKSFQVILGLSGTLHFELEGEKRSIKSDPGSIFILAPGIRHSWHSEENQVCENFMFFCDGFTDEDFELGQIFNTTRLDIVVYLKLKPKIYNFYVNSFRKLIRNYDPLNVNILHGLLYAFCGEICSQARSLGIFDEHIKQHPGLTKAMKIIHQNYRRKIKLKDLSRYSGLSQSRLSEIFKSTFGMSPIQYINDLKIKKASQLLAYSDMNITQIAEYLGFNSLHYFSRFFKKKTSMQPSAFMLKK